MARIRPSVSKSGDGIRIDEYISVVANGFINPEACSQPRAPNMEIAYNEL